jgi:uncharacterized protein
MASAETIDARLLRLDADGSISLLAGRRPDGRIIFPLPDAEPECAVEALPRRGTLWSWTVQRFRPKSPPYAGPEAFQPYAVGYVDLGEVIVEARLIGPWEGLRLGMPMVLVAETFPFANGEARVTFAFTPAGDSA